jgi:spermidine synthase
MPDRFIGFPIDSLATPRSDSNRNGTGALNLAVVAFGLYYFDLKPKTRLQLTLVTALLTILLGVGLWQATWIGDMMENRLYQDGIVYSDQSPYQKIVMTNHKRDLRLFLNGQLQFSSVDEHRYHESLVHPAFGLHRSPKRVLVLGAGDGLATREILRYPSVEEIILCDLDEKVSNLAKNFSPLTKLNQNSLHDPRVRIVHQDAFSYLFEDQDPFDVILADLPDPSTPLLAKLYSREFYRRIMALLKKDGIFATQATSPFTAPEAYHTIVSTIRATGLRARPYRTFIPSFGEWGFVLASPQPLNLQNWKPIADLRFLNPDLFPSLFTWSSDSLSPEPTIVSTLDNISVTFAYQKALEREL